MTITGPEEEEGGVPHRRWKGGAAELRHAESGASRTQTKVNLASSYTGSRLQRVK